MSEYVGAIQATSWLFQRCLAAIFLVAFVVALKQFPALLGSNGLLPAPDYLKRVSFLESPSIFHAGYSDTRLRVVAWCGIMTSLIMLSGAPDNFPWWCSTLMWLAMYWLYLSIVNIGQQFYSFGWESMLLEAGFFAAFLGPASMSTPVVPFLILRWMLFRAELGAGLIKLRHDECWRDLTCLYYHHETQPLPNPLSWYFHRLPKFALRSGVLFSHIVQVGMPILLFLPQPFSAIAGVFIIVHQLILIIGGNYSWLNWITVFLALTAFNDSTLLMPFTALPAPPAAYPPLHAQLMSVLLGVAIVLSVQPTINLFKKDQLMNYSYNPLHLVNTYGAFGSMSRERYEVVIEGTTDDVVTSNSKWQEYEFKAKPGKLNRTPPQVAPYHLRLDWLMWFIPFSVVRHKRGILTPGYDLWFIRFIQKLLQGDSQTIKLLASNPFGNRAPEFIRARYYLYEFTDPDEKRASGNWWKRTLIGDYLPPVSLEDLLGELTGARGRKSRSTS